jgi:hypothetical protein
MLRLLCVLVLLAALPARAEETPGQAPDEPGVDAQLDGLREGVCRADEALCRHVKAFGSAVAPCFPQGDRLSVGQAWLVSEQGDVLPVEYFALHVQRVRDVTLIQSQHVYSENDEEKQAAEDMVAGVRSGKIDPGNALYRYLEGHRADVPQLMAEREGRSLVVRREGPALYLRQAGKVLYVASPGAILSAPGPSGSREGMLFAVLPALASCQ